MTRILLAWLAVVAVACGERDHGLDLPDDICEGQTCSGHGTCIHTGSVPTCECEPAITPRA